MVPGDRDFDFYSALMQPGALPELDEITAGRSGEPDQRWSGKLNTAARNGETRPAAGTDRVSGTSTRSRSRMDRHGPE